MAAADPVSVVIPVHNGARWLPGVLAAIARECAGRPHEVIIVDDGSTDRSAAVCRMSGVAHLWLVDGPRRGAAAAINEGLRQARFAFVAQIDQDVIVQAGWLSTLLAAMADPGVAAAQGWYRTDRSAPALCRVMAMDLEQRYARIPSGATDHVCTGNVLWRRAAIVEVGLLDETLGYGYDNDLSYRLVAAGYRLRICPAATSLHRWREGLLGYLSQQYGFGYGRLDLVGRHRWRVSGDAVSPAVMMAHPILMAIAVALGGAAVIASLAGADAARFTAASLLVIGALIAERSVAAFGALRRWRDPAALLFPFAHLARNLAWVAAMICWCARRVAQRASLPSHSMRPRPDERRRPLLMDER